MKKTFIALILIGSLLLVSANSYGAVTSVGEINVAGQKEGVVRHFSTVSLLVTLAIDRSLAEPGEEIKVIEITMPDAPKSNFYTTGFLIQSSYFRGILRDGNQIVAQAVVSGGMSYTLNLQTLSLIFRTRSMKLLLIARHQIQLFQRQFSEYACVILIML